ncbi:hypothetical protein Zmor_000250 [Zophobas morio]|uniref:Sodium channel protein Nach n=1 Tax=Zophobas morio TaxID=2755281 RepID=A0AA38MQ98_9CUCU|nr:hypothetical protein Zmor_000250 [Zophobas morio]
MTNKVEPIQLKKYETTTKTNNSNYKKLISGYFSEFLKNSSIHGIQYISGAERTLFERSFWLIVLSISIYSCVALIKSAWSKWDENPIFISFRQTPVNIWEIPFPAVTVCPMYTMNRESNFTFAFRPNLQGNTSWKMGNVSSFCDNRENYFTEYEDANFADSPEWTQFLVQTSPGRDQIFSGCGWIDKEDCEIFSPLLTPWGICFSFNMLKNDDIFTTNAHRSYTYETQNNISTRNWNIETNYPKTDQAVYPWRSSNVQDSLNFLLTNNLSQIECGAKHYYQIFLHHPAELPESDLDSINVQHNHLHEIIIQPGVTFTSDNLKTYSPEKRKCFYASERKLYFYKIYTLNNCRMECLANYTLKLCGCVPHFLPHNKTTTLCAINKYDVGMCLITAKVNMGNLESAIWHNKSKASCNCLPSCNSITYNNRFKTLDVDATVIIISYKDNEFLALERQELFGDINFWASCGGILGLFTGFSVISLAEIIYYLCLKLVYNLGKFVFRKCVKS